MRQFIIMAIATAIVFNANGQVFKRLTERAKSKIEQKAGDKVDKTIDDAVSGKKKGNKQAGPSDSADGAQEDAAGQPASDESAGSNASAGSDGSSSEKNKAPGLTAYSKYDFVPGEKLQVYENFAQDAIGDFPAKWNTNAAGEVVTLDGKEGKWLKLNKEGAFLPEFITNLPDNFTLEFDLGVNNTFSYYSGTFFMNFVNLAKPDSEFAVWGNRVDMAGNHVVRIGLHPRGADDRTGSSEVMTSLKGATILSNRVGSNEFFYKKSVAHISIWRQKQRIRMYVNNEKVWDLPRAFAEGSTYNSVVFGIGSMHQEGDFYVLNNIRLAVGAPDTRNKLITEGKFVTRGILFDVNSAVVKAESYGTIKDIANVLKENSTVRVNIIGHTDSDGDDQSNMDLSKKRAAAVKNALATEFGIDASRIETDGKGESQPVDKADTPVAKANNRRVEFVKL